MAYLLGKVAVMGITINLLPTETVVKAAFSLSDHISNFLTGRY